MTLTGKGKADHERRGGCETVCGGPLEVGSISMEGRLAAIEAEVRIVVIDNARDNSTAAVTSREKANERLKLLQLLRHAVQIVAL
jgi:hypothetical protein